MVDVIDQQIGRVIKYLEDNGELDNTVSILDLNSNQINTYTACSLWCL